MTEQREEDGRSRRPSNAGEPAGRFLFPVDGEQSRAVLEIACDLVADAGGDLFLAAPVQVGEQIEMGADEPRLHGDRTVGKFALEATSICGCGTDIHEVVRVGRDRDAMLAGMVESLDITTLIETSTRDSGRRSIFQADFSDRRVEDTCDVITVSRISAVESIDSILVGVAAGPHARLAIDVARSLARRNDASLESLHVEDDGASSDDRIGDRVLTKAVERAGDVETVTRTLLESASVSRTIVEHADDHDITVMGAPRAGRFKQVFSPTIPATVSERASGTVLIAHRAGVETSWLDRLI